MSFIKETQVVPSNLQSYLTRLGGKNPYGKPNWRLVFSHDVWVKEAGVYRDWDENLTTAERGGFNFEQTEEKMYAQIGGKAFEELGEQPQWAALRHDNKPIRTVVEVRENQRYPMLDGWIMELWFPAFKYGSPEHWYSFKAVDGATSMLGEYPHEGDYEMIYGPYPRQPSIAQMELWVRKYHVDRENMRMTGTPKQRAIEYVDRYERHQKEQWGKRRLEYQAEMMDIWKSVATSGSLEMNRYRQELATQAGQTSHVGTLPAI